MAGDAGSGGRIVAGQHHHLHAHVLQAPDGRRRAGPQLVGDRQQADHNAFLRQHHHGLPAAGQPCQPAALFIRQAAHPCRRSEPEQGAVGQPGTDAMAGFHGKIRYCCCRDALPVRTFQHGAGQRVFRSLLQPGSPGKQGFAWHAGQRLHFGQHRAAFGPRAGLVDHQCVDFLGPLKRGGIAEQQAGLRPAAYADHDGGRRGQPQGTRAGNHQHRHRMDQPDGGTAGPPPAAKEGQHGQPHHYRHEHAGNAVGQPLDRCLGTLCLRHQPHDFCQLGLVAHAGHAHLERTFDIAGAGVHAGIHGFFHRQAFA